MSEHDQTEVPKEIRFSFFKRGEDDMAPTARIPFDWNRAAITVREHLATTVLGRTETPGMASYVPLLLGYYGDVINQFSDAGSMILVEQVSQAMLKKAAILSSLGLHQEELLVYEGIEHLVRSTDNLEIFPEYVAAAGVNRALTLTKLGRTADARKAVQDILKEFGESREDAVIEQVAKAAKLDAVLSR